MCMWALARRATGATQAEGTVMYLLLGGARSAARGPSAALLLTEPLRGLVDLPALLAAAPGSKLPGREQQSRPINVPSTSGYSRLDGIVAWQACVEPEAALHQNVEVRRSHVGFGVDPATLWLIADRLARPAGPQAPLRPPRPRARPHPPAAPRPR